MKYINNVDEITEYLIEEKVLLMQTDTVFGLVCRGDSEQATKRVEDIKQRDHNAFGYFFRDINMAEKYVKIDTEQKKNIFKKVFPGFFTLIFEATDYAMKILPNQAFGINKIGKKTLGVRIPDNKIILKAMQKTDIFFPLLATSANISKHPTPTSFESIDEQIINRVDAIVYDKNVKHNAFNSTIIDLSTDKIEVIRKGSGDLSLINIY